MNPEPRPGGDRPEKRKRKKLSMNTQRSRKPKAVDDSLDRQFKTKGFRYRVDYDQLNITPRKSS